MLPTKLYNLNVRASAMNCMLNDYIENSNHSIRLLNFDSFAIEGSLNSEYGSYLNSDDAIHLGKPGIRRLATEFRDAVFFRVRDKRAYNSVLKGHSTNESNSSVASCNGENGGTSDYNLQVVT